MNTAQWALSYAVRGWSVFPLWPGAKTPLTEHGQNEATTDPERIERWWRDTPAANVGIHARPSGLYVIDVDCGPGKVGATSWEALRAEYGDTPTYTVGTRSGGLHLYYTAPAGVDLANTAGRLGLDIDTRGNGYVVAPPSVVDGRPYTVLAGIDPAPLPAWVVDRLGARRGNGGSAPTINGHRPGWAGPSVEVDLFRPPARAFTPADAWRFVLPHLDRLAAARTGTINHALNDAAKALSHFGNEFWTFEQAVGWLMAALSYTEYDGRTWRAEATIDSAYRSAAGDWRAELRPEGARFPSAEVGNSRVVGVAAVPAANRIVDPSPWLDGTYVAPEPTVGVVRGDGKPLLYPGRWHTVIGPTGSAKTWLALAHVRDELNAGRVVAYAHFEEATMGSTIARLLSIGVTPERIRAGFKWLECAERWQAGEMAEIVATERPSLVVLDGINAACAQHDQDPSQVAAVGWYQATFVKPACGAGAAVLSLGHPPKGKDRQGERHGYGSTAWLDLVDGVGFRLEPHKEHPVRKGANGSAVLYSAKDRHGSVEALGSAAAREGWTYLGSLWVDNATDPLGQRTSITLTAPRPGDLTGSGAAGDPVIALANAIVAVLSERPDRSYSTQQELEDLLQDKGVKFNKNDMGAALGHLVSTESLSRDPAGAGRRRGGQLLATNNESESDLPEFPAPP